MPGPTPRADAERPRVLVCGWAGAGNIGDELLTDWVVAQLEHAGAIVVLVTRSVTDTVERHPSVRPVGWRPWDIARVLTDVDGVCVGPGGIIQDGSSVWNLPAHLCRPLLGRAKRLPVAGLGLGAEPLRRRSSRWLLRRALAGAVGVVVRDEPSADAMRTAGVAADVAADLVFDLPAVGAPDGRDGHLVVALGPRLAPGRFTPAARRQDHGDLGPAADAITAVADRLDVDVAVTAFRGAADVEFGAGLVELMGNRARLVPTSAAAIRAAIAGASAVISSRFHASVLGLVEGTPVLVVSRETKLRSLVDSIDDPGRIRLVSSIAELADCEIPDPFPTGITPRPVDPNRVVLARLVDAARGRRTG